MTIKKTLLAAALFGGAGFGLSGAQASAVYGTLSNFDVFNDSPNTYYGFEIELEGFDSSSIANNGSGYYYTYNNWHYGAGQIVSNGTSTIVRYYNGGSGSTVPYTSPVGPTDGHTCITINGCEHFGLGMYGSPTATRYYWLDAAGNRSTPVDLLGAPAVYVNPPAAPAQPLVVQFVLPAPPAPEPEDLEDGQKFSDAVWVKVMKTELDLEHQAALDDLMADNPDQIADAEDPNAVEVEWKLMQRRLAGAPDDPANELDSGEQDAGAGAEQVLRTYQFFAFTGTYDAEHEAMCAGDEAGTCEDDLALDNPDYTANLERYVGRLIGQQMVAADLGALELPAQVPVPGAVWLFGSALAGFLGLSRRKSA